MSKLDWRRARKGRPAPAFPSRLDRAADRILATPGEKQVARLRRTMVKTASLSKQQKRQNSSTACTHCGRKGASILITAGAGADGCLDVHMLCSRPCVIVAGFPWAGRQG